MADKRNRTPFYGAVPTSKLQADHVFMADGSTAEEALQDYIVDEGVDGIWTYRKWNSGIAECWGTMQCEITGWSAWGSLYETQSSTRNALFPTGLFNVPPVCVATPAGNSMGTLLETAGSATSEHTPTYIHIRPTTGYNTTLSINIYAKGTWK